MKKIDTEYISGQKADLAEIGDIIHNLFTDESEEWLCLFDTSKKNPNYIQTHSDIEDFEDDALHFLNQVLQIPLAEIDEIPQIYLVEYRKYENKENFKHYRAFFTDSDTVYSFFEKYMNDEEIDTENWMEVTEEFIE